MDSRGNTFEAVSIKFDESDLTGHWRDNSVQPATYSEPITDFTEDLESDDEAPATVNAVPPVEAVRVHESDSEEESFSDAPEAVAAPLPGGALDDDGIRHSTRQRRPPQRFWELNPGEHFAMLTYSQAIKSLDAAMWWAAMQKEMANFEKYKVYDLVDLPAGKTAINGEWVNSRKKDADGNETGFRSRWVIHGNHQVAGIDFFDTFAPVARQATLRIALALAVQYDLNVRQVDITAAYLNGDLDEEVYMMQPKGFVQGSKVALLKKGLYGLKQAGRSWNKKLNATLLKEGLIRSKADLCAYFKGSLQNLSNFVLVLVYVDDILLIGASAAASDVDRVMKRLQDDFEVKDLGSISRYLGNVVKRNPGEIFIGQADFSLEVLQRFNMEQSKAVSTPMQMDSMTSAEEGEPMTNMPYRSVIGSVMYLSTSTRPDISFAVGMLSRFLEKPTERHWNSAMYLLRYIKGTQSAGLIYKQTKGPFVLTGWADSDWGTDKETGKSVGGYAIFLGECLVSWKSKRQTTVATSSTAAELEALYVGANEGIWIELFLTELNWTRTMSIKWFQDNNGSIQTVQSEKNLEKTKHMLIKIHYLRELLAQQKIVLERRDTSEMVADMLTKALGKGIFEKLRATLGMALGAAA